MADLPKFIPGDIRAAIEAVSGKVWWGVLRTFEDSGHSIIMAEESAQLKDCALILICDHAVPMPDRDSESFLWLKKGAGLPEKAKGDS